MNPLIRTSQSLQHITLLFPLDAAIFLQPSALQDSLSSTDRRVLHSHKRLIAVC
jgi:hypothetical protein